MKNLGLVAISTNTRDVDCPIQISVTINIFFMLINNVYLTKNWPCHASGGSSPVSHRGGLGSVQPLSVCDRWLNKWRWDRFSTEYFGLPVLL
jgi:hypothetical protein